MYLARVAQRSLYTAGWEGRGAQPTSRSCDPKDLETTQLTRPLMTHKINARFISQTAKTKISCIDRSSARLIPVTRGVSRRGEAGGGGGGARGELLSSLTL